MVQVTRHRNRRGISLIEVMMVVSILTILAAVVLPRFSYSQEETKHNAMAVTIKTIQKKIAEHHAVHGQWPATIDPNWFQPPVIPENLYRPGTNEIIVQNIPGKTELIGKHRRGRELYWYNRVNGVFHTSVLWQGSDQATLDLYNRVNHAEAVRY